MPAEVAVTARHACELAQSAGAGIKEASERTAMGQVGRHTLAKLCIVYLMWPLAGCGSNQGGSRVTSVEPLTGANVRTLDLSDSSACQPSWVYRVEECSLSVEPDGSLLCDVRGSDDAGGGQYGGVRLRTGPLTGLELQLTLVNPENLDGLWVAFGDQSGGEIERWHSMELAKVRVSPLTLRSGQGAPGFKRLLSEQERQPEAVDVFVKLKGLNARAGFALQSVRYLSSGKAQAAKAPAVGGPPAAGEVTLTGQGVVEFDLRDEAKRLPAWVYRVRSYALKQEADGAVSCQIKGSGDTDGGQYGGMRFMTEQVSAVEFEVSFSNPGAIEAVFAAFRSVSASTEVERWTWMAPGSGPYSLVFLGGSESTGFQHLIPRPGVAPDAVDLFVKLKGTNENVGFTVRKMRFRR